MPDEGPYRDELAAARDRIAVLERRVADLGTLDARARRLAALLRERTHVDAMQEPPRIWPRLWWLFLVFAAGGVALLFQGDLVFGLLALLAPVAMGVGATRYFAAQADAARRQRALLDREIAALEQGDRPALLDPAALDPPALPGAPAPGGATSAPST